MLNKFRDSLQPMMRKLGLTFASLGVSANFWTTISLATSIAAGAVYAIAHHHQQQLEWRYQL